MYFSIFYRLTQVQRTFWCVVYVFVSNYMKRITAQVPILRLVFAEPSSREEIDHRSLGPLIPLVLIWIVRKTNIYYPCNNYNYYDQWHIDPHFLCWFILLQGVGDSNTRLSGPRWRNLILYPNHDLWLIVTQKQKHVDIWQKRNILFKMGNPHDMQTETESTLVWFQLLHHDESKRWNSTWRGVFC